MPLWSERGLIGMLLLGPKRDGGLYTQEEIEIARASGERLSPADVQKIAEALLLWNGNHVWKVTDVAERPDNTVGFSYAAGDGTVIARFSVDV